MTTRTVALVPLLVGVLATASPGSISVDLTDPFTGADSGWTAIIADNTHNGISVDSVEGGVVRIEISKTFYQPPAEGSFIPNIITFNQRLPDAQAASTIEIMDETILNGTGSDWTDYHWKVTAPFAAINKLNTTTSGFSIGPFSTAIWVAASGWDANHANELDVAGGTVPAGATYRPGLAQGSLFIDVNLSLADTSFDLTQQPTPEPATLSVLACAAMGMLIRRRNK
ncbi:MAG: hypothetical protein ACE15C_10465 [Phycisphaerae bacterium]